MKKLVKHLSLFLLAFALMGVPAIDAGISAANTTKHAQTKRSKKKSRKGSNKSSRYSISRNKKVNELYRKAMQGDANAMFDLGFCYENARGLEFDFDKAIEWYLKAAEGGNVMAMYCIGRAYNKGWVNYYSEPEKAFEWFNKAAEQGHIGAIRELGNFYRIGIVVDVSSQKAVSLYSSAAQLGDKEAMYKLAECYQYGFGVDKNSVKANEWLNKAERTEEPAPYDLDIPGYYEIKEEVIPQVPVNQIAIVDSDKVKKEVMIQVEQREDNTASGVVNQQGSDDADRFKAVQEDVKVVEEPASKAGKSGNPADKIFTAVEEPAQFPGGRTAMMEWIESNLRYPKRAQQNDIEGRVIVKFVVNADGSIEQATVLKGVDKDLDQEALRVVKKMPKWKPGKNNGKAVRSYFTIPVTFKLTRDPEPLQPAE